MDLNLFTTLKTPITFLFFAFFAAFTHAQSTFQLEWDSINNTYEDCSNAWDIGSETIEINNISDSTIYLGFKYEVIAQSGSFEVSSTVFLDNGFPAFIDSFAASNDPVDPGLSIWDVFYCFADPNSAPGTLSVMYTVWNLADTTDYQTALFHFVAEDCTGLDEEDIWEINVGLDQDQLVVLSPNSGTATIEILNLSGQALQTHQLQLNEGAAQRFNLAGLPSGVYFVRVLQAGMTYRAKVFIPKM